MMVSSFFRRYIVALVIGIGFIFSPSTTLFAASAPAAAPPPDTETRSLILGVEFCEATWDIKTVPRK